MNPTIAHVISTAVDVAWLGAVACLLVGGHPGLGAIWGVVLAAYYAAERGERP